MTNELKPVYYRINGRSHTKKDEISIKFGNTFKELRIQKGLTLDGIAEITGLQKDKLEKIEDGYLCLTFTEAVMITEILGMRLYEFLKLIEQ